MSHKYLFKWLERLSKLGSPGYNLLEHVEKIITNLEDNFLQCLLTSESSPDDEEVVKELLTPVQISLSELLSKIDDVGKSDARIVCGCHVIAVLQEIHRSLLKETSGDESGRHEENDEKSRKNPPAPPGLISVQQTKIVEDAMHLVIYTVVLGCLTAEASQYVKLMVIKSKFVLGANLVSVSSSSRQGLLTHIAKIMLSIMEHPSLGTALRGPLFPELLSVLLDLCFAPGNTKDHPGDTAYFREQLERVLGAMDTNQTLQHFLLLKGVTKNGGWLQKVCGSFIVRRYLMQPGGVAAVIGAGLTLCDGQDWKRCEAVAALISHAKFPDIDLYYATIGPQVCALMLEKDLKPEILRVVMLVVSELAQKSATLTSLHVTNGLMQPLLDITVQHRVGPEDGRNLTLCVNRIHKLFVEVGIPNASFLNLLQPVIDPLMAVASFPASHLRTLAQQCLTRFLSQLPVSGVIEILLHVSRVCVVSTVPTVNPCISFCLDEDGGIKTNVVEATCQEKTLENDEELTKAIIKVLETLQNPLVVRCFYEKLVLHIDFSVLNEKPLSSTSLLTNDDIRSDKFEAVRRVYISCSLLSHLADSEQLTNDLFQNLSAAVPIVNTLLRTSCQRCDDESLHKTKLSFLLNVVMMVSCYVNERILINKMGSDDWKGLKLLLPALEEIKNTISDEAVLLFVDQLRNIVVTRGVIKDVSGKKLSEDTITVENRKIRSEEGNTVKSDSGGESSSLNQSTGKRKGQTSRKDQHFNREGDVKNSNEKYSYQKAMEDVVSPILPTRGHGLLSLSKLIEERDSETLSHKEQLLSLFQHSLKEEDSYLYLMAIQGLAVLCDVFPDKVIEILTKEFSVGGRSPEDRAKLAETLARACRRLGPVLPHYKCHFINSLLTGVRDKEAIVRASSLSSLGEVCKILRFSLGPILHEIFGVLQAVVDGDKAMEVRRAAILVVTLILQGLGREAFTLLKDVIRDLYRVLRLVHARDQDDVVKLHAQLAMEEIDTITKDFLLPKLNLTKRIYVADIPCNQFL